MSEDTPVTDAPLDDADHDSEIAPPETNGWWNFTTKEDAVEWVNDKVQKRLAREKSKIDPVITERDTLKKRVAELEPFEQATKTDTQRWEDERAALASQLEELQTFRQKAERNDLVREIAEDKGLPSRFLNRVQGTDADSITADIEDLMTVLSDGKPAKPAATRKPQDPDATPSSKGYSGGGAKDEPDNKSVVENIRKKFRENNNRTFAR